MPRKRIGRRTYGGRSDDDLRLESIEGHFAKVFYQPSAQKLEDAAVFSKKTWTEPFPKLLEIGRTVGPFFTMFPINTLATHPEFLEPKYKQIRSISLDRWKFDIPASESEVREQLDELPSGFVKDPSYGLGLLKDYRFIIDAIEAIPGINHLVLSWERPTGIADDLYFLSFMDYDEIRRAINRITSGKQEEASTDKWVVAHNALLTTVLPTQFPEETRPYKPGTIFKLVGAEHRTSPYSKADRDAAVRVVERSTRRMAKESPSQLLKLKSDIELVTLESLIARFEVMLHKNLAEGAWQQLFNDNPFILNLAFGYPVTKVRDLAHVGGQTITGSGGSIADFLVKNKLSKNIALFEIKTPQSGLLGGTYREQLYGPARELVGAVNQVLDQRYELTKNIAMLKENSRDYDLESYAVHGVLVIGRTPDGHDRQRSFELYRGNSKDVSIFTFDELLEKLKALFQFLSEHNPEVARDAELRRLETQVLQILSAIHQSYDHSPLAVSDGLTRGSSHPKPGVDGQAMMALGGKAAVLKTGFERVRLDQPPFPLGFYEDGNRVLTTPSVEEFLQRASVLVTTFEAEFQLASRSKAN